MSKLRILSVTSEFPAVPDEIWKLLIRIETLQYIASPILMFTPISDKGGEWRVGQTAAFRLRLMRILPLGPHTVNLETIDPTTYTIQTRENSRLLPTWNHRIKVEETGHNASLYTDTLEIGAGWRTDFIYLFAKFFFRHRHRRWRKLLKR